MAKLGEWRWHLGMDEDDDEMGDYGTREAAIKQGLREYKPGESFWIVEARYLASHEKAMGDEPRDTAPFASARHGTWIRVGKDGKAIEAPSHG